MMTRIFDRLTWVAIAAAASATWKWLPEMAGTKNSGGRNARSRAMHLIDGTFRKDRHALPSPAPPTGKPVPPKALAGDALDEWGRMITRLELSHTLSVVDDAALYQYCRLFAETEQICVTQEETEGSIEALESNLAGLKGSELVECFQEITKLRQLEARYTTQIRQGRMALRSYLVEFGLTPSARNRVKVSADSTAPANPLDRFIKKAK